LWVEYSNGTHSHIGATVFFEAAGLQTSMTHYKFGRTLKRNMSDSISDKCEQPPCDQPVFNQAKAVCDATRLPYIISGHMRPMRRFCSTKYCSK
jgi:hypothetical protein